MTTAYTSYQSISSGTTDFIAIKSATAIRNIRRDLGNQVDLASAIHKDVPNAKISSCALTVHVIGQAVNAKPLTAGKTTVWGRSWWDLCGCFGTEGPMPMTSEAIIDDIMRLLNQSVLIGISVSPDHHFVVLPMSTSGDEIAIIQGFQDSYILCQWLDNCGTGTLTKGEFKQELLALVTSSNQQTWTDAAVRLFSFDSSDTASSQTKARIRQDMATWFCSKPFIVAYAYKDL